MIGIDIAKVDRFDKPLLNKIALPNEIKYINKTSSQKLIKQKIASLFSAKEAVMKALGLGKESGVSFKDIELLHYESGKPYVNLYGKALEQKEKLYKNILKNIRTIYPNFNIGMSTSARGDFSNNWKDPYRHWCFKSKNSVFDSTLTKKAKNSILPT